MIAEQDGGSLHKPLTQTAMEPYTEEIAEIDIGLNGRKPDRAFPFRHQIQKVCASRELEADRTALSSLAFLYCDEALRCRRKGALPGAMELWSSHHRHTVLN